MMIIPDELKKTVRIPGRIKNGGIEYFYDGNKSVLDKIKNGTFIELIVPENALQDKELANKLNTEQKVFFLPKGTVLLACMNVDKYTDDLKRFIISAEAFIYGNAFEIELLEEQSLIIRESKKSKLTTCRCKIPLLDKEALSLNHAYTLISQKVETNRRSHSGNVFEKLFYKENGAYEKIGKLRDLIEAREESKLFEQSPGKNKS